MYAVSAPLSNMFLARLAGLNDIAASKVASMVCLPWQLNHPNSRHCPSNGTWKPIKPLIGIPGIPETMCDSSFVMQSPAMQSMVPRFHESLTPLYEVMNAAARKLRDITTHDDPKRAELIEDSLSIARTSDDPKSIFSHSLQAAICSLNFQARHTMARDAKALMAANISAKLMPGPYDGNPTIRAVIAEWSTWLYDRMAKGEGLNQHPEIEKVTPHYYSLAARHWFNATALFKEVEPLSYELAMERSLVYTQYSNDSNTTEAILKESASLYARDGRYADAIICYLLLPQGIPHTEDPSEEYLRRAAESIRLVLGFSQQTIPPSKAIAEAERMQDIIGKIV